MASTDFDYYNKKIATFICSSALLASPLVSDMASANEMFIVDRYAGPMIDRPVEVRYGGPMIDRPVEVRYGGPMIDKPMEVRYGGPMIDRPVEVRYGGPMIDAAKVGAETASYQNVTPEIRSVKDVSIQDIPSVTDSGVVFGRDQSILGRFIFK